MDPKKTIRTYNTQDPNILPSRRQSCVKIAQGGFSSHSLEVPVLTAAGRECDPCGRNGRADIDPGVRGYPYRPAEFSGSTRQAVQVGRAGDQEEIDCTTTGCMRSKMTWPYGFGT